MYEVFLTQRALLDPEDIAVLDREAIPERMPFFVHSETFDYPADLNSYLRKLPSRGVASFRSWLNQAQEIAVWCRYLQEVRGQQDLWQATREDAESYYRSRRLVDPTTSISASTWNQQAHHLASLYDYAITSQLAWVNPFRHNKVWSLNGVQTALDEGVVQERHAKKDSMRFHTLEEYTLLRDVGFAGMLPGGSRDPDYTPRDKERNVAFVEMLVTTGMRITEAASLCRHELLAPAREGFRKSVPIAMPPSITKGNRTRTVLLPLRVQKAIQSYLSIERAAAVEKAQLAGEYDVGSWVRVRSYTSQQFVTEDGRRIRWDKCSPALRRQLLEVLPDGKLDPFWTWLSTNGKTVAPSSWTFTFRTAVARCRAAGISLESSPHKLRHTFAVHMLNLLESRRVGASELSESRQFSGNSLRQVQLLLGHTSVDTTTQYYLGTADLMSGLLDDTAGEYAERVESS